MVFQLQEHVSHQQEKAIAVEACLKETKKELEKARRCVVDFERTMVKKDSNLKQKIC